MFNCNSHLQRLTRQLDLLLKLLLLLMLLCFFIIIIQYPLLAHYVQLHFAVSVIGLVSVDSAYK
jgi:uncharacterized membrane protein (DUF485 family)